jgi:hypothetical protein|tara:strand:- start:38 stop:202 length:165 start_codon:yes stop_codon:yes gene_type:complete
MVAVNRVLVRMGDFDDIEMTNTSRAERRTRNGNPAVSKEAATLIECGFNILLAM